MSPVHGTRAPRLRRGPRRHRRPCLRRLGCRLNRPRSHHRDRRHPLSTGGSTAGGGGAIDFWKIHLNGGEKLQFEAAYPAASSGWYTFQLFSPGTNDGNFPSALAIDGGTTNGNATRGVADVQAPYNGTFIVAVCQDVNYQACINVESGSGIDPMTAYTFTTSLVTTVSAATAAKEVRANPVISGARTLSLKNFEAGGGDAIDFWKVHLTGGDKVQFEAAYPAASSGWYTLQLFSPGTNDGNFPSARPLAGGTTNGNATRGVVNVKAPYTGTFVLAVCQDVNYQTCVNVESGSGVNPMTPYTFTPSLIGGSETRTSVRLSAPSVKYGHEKGFRFTVRVSAIFGGKVTGKVVISDGKKALCAAKVVNGKGYCALSSNIKIPAGKYAIVGAYTGSRDASTSGAYTLKVTG